MPSRAHLVWVCLSAAFLASTLFILSGVFSDGHRADETAQATEPPVAGSLLVPAEAAAMTYSATAGAANQTRGSEPWTSSQVLQPEDLARALADPKGKKPAVVCVGLDYLYKNGHIPGADFHGPGANPEGLEDLKNWAKNVSKEQTVVVYCGCCPLFRCPNVRPAFRALRDMGFKEIKVLYLATDFTTDWAQKGYPVAKGG